MAACDYGQLAGLDQSREYLIVENRFVGAYDDGICKPVSPPFYPGQGGVDVPSVNRPATGLFTHDLQGSVRDE